MGCYLDGSGQPLQMGKHGTNVAQPSPQPTGGGDGPNPQQPDEITVTDYVTVEDSD